MSTLNFQLANTSDDAELRERMANDWMPGNISVSFRREPNYFYGSGVQGSNSQIIKCTESGTGKLIGLGSRFINETYVNGEAKKTGYLADLRAHPSYRGKTALVRGYRYLRKLHEQDPVSLYYSMILNDNETAKKILTSARCGLPLYRDIGKFLTPAIFLDIPKKSLTIPGVSFRRAVKSDTDSIFEFLAQNVTAKQFAPVVTKDDLKSARLRDLNIEDFYLACQGEEIIGVLAAWDQSRFRQTYIERYNLTLSLLRPLYNSISRFTPLKPFPSPGHHVPYFYLAFCTIKHNEPTIFRALLRYLYNDRRKGKWHYFIAGLHEQDPLSSILAEYRRIDVAGRLYIVHYPENQAEYEQLDKRVPYVEIAMI